MLYAFIEGLAGIEDRSRLFEKARLSPRWAAADVDRAEVFVSYASSGAGIGYSFDRREDRISLAVRASGSGVDFHVLLPAGSSPRGVRAAGRNVSFDPTRIEESPYVDFHVDIEGEVQVEILL